MSIFEAYHEGDFIKPPQSMRDDFSFSNSPAAVARFPFPWPEDEYMYSVNLEPHPGGAVGSPFERDFDVDEHYLSDMEDRRITLEKDGSRYQALSHMRLAQWDTLELLMDSLAKDYPQYFQLEKEGTSWTWENKPLGIKDTFEFGQCDSLPYEPAEYIFRQVQGDFVVMDQRDGDLYADLGITTSAADWSLRFDVGMSFNEWHGPVPRAKKLGVLDRALQFLLNLRQGEPSRRLNWTLTVNPRQDTATESYHLWGEERSEVTAENAGEKVHLRVELQTLYRLPRSNAILFSVRAYLCSFADLARQHPALAKRAHRVLKGLPQDIVDYKGATLYRDSIVDWLSQYDDGQ